jgi:hypothetical protein
VRKGVVAACIVAAASSGLIAASLEASSGPGASFAGRTARGTYSLFLRTQCDDGCARHGQVVIELTAGRDGVTAGACPYGADQLATARIVHGSFDSGVWVWIASGRFRWLWVFGRLLSPTRVVGVVKGPAVCGGRDTYSLRAAPA